MSSNYMRLLPREPPQKMYGFEKKSATEVTDIVSRLTKRTYSSELHNNDGMIPLPPRTPSARCRRATEDAAEVKRDKRSRKEVKRIFRRLRTPTMSYRSYRGEVTPLHDLSAHERGEDEPRSQEETQKIVRRVTRPTTVSRARSFCHYCKDPELEEYQDVDWSEDKVVTQDELDVILKRVTSPTVASEGGKTKRCARRKDSLATLMADRRKLALPLVSGMPRSRDMNEITERVYRPFERRRVPAATAVVYT